MLKVASYVFCIEGSGNSLCQNDKVFCHLSTIIWRVHVQYCSICHYCTPAAPLKNVILGFGSHWKPVVGPFGFAFTSRVALVQYRLRVERIIFTPVGMSHWTRSPFVQKSTIVGEEIKHVSFLSLARII